MLDEDYFPAPRAHRCFLQATFDLAHLDRHLRKEASLELSLETSLYPFKTRPIDICKTKNMTCNVRMRIEALEFVG